MVDCAWPPNALKGRRLIRPLPGERSYTPDICEGLTQRVDCGMTWSKPGTEGMTMSLPIVDSPALSLTTWKTSPVFATWEQVTCAST